VLSWAVWESLTGWSDRGGHAMGRVANSGANRLRACPELSASGGALGVPQNDLVPLAFQFVGRDPLADCGGVLAAGCERLVVLGVTLVAAAQPRLGLLDQDGVGGSLLVVRLDAGKCGTVTAGQVPTLSI
jgi:hypothetical protein